MVADAEATSATFARAARRRTGLRDAAVVAFAVLRRVAARALLAAAAACFLARLAAFNAARARLSSALASLLFFFAALTSVRALSTAAPELRAVAVDFFAGTFFFMSLLPMKHVETVSHNRRRIYTGGAQIQALEEDGSASARRGSPEQRLVMYR